MRAESDNAISIMLAYHFVPLVNIGVQTQPPMGFHVRSMLRI